MKNRQLAWAMAVVFTAVLGGCGDASRFERLAKTPFKMIEHLTVTKTDHLASAIASEKNAESVEKLEAADHRAEENGAVTAPSLEVSGQVTFSKKGLFETVFLYGFDLQYSSDIDVEYELIPQSTAMGHVPATFRRVGDLLQLVADQSRLFESDVNHPESLIAEYKIVAESSTTLTVAFERSGLLLNSVFNGATTSVPKQTWIRSLKYDDAKSLLLQESGLMLENGAVQTFMESLFPRESLVPEGYAGKFADSELEPLAERYRFLSNESVYMPVDVDGNSKRVKTGLLSQYNIGSKDEAQKTIDFYVTPNIPEKFLPVVRSGVEGWNRYFEPQTGRKVMRFKGRLPAGISLGDPRYNVINWDNVADAGAAYESSASDPTTGIQSHSLIYMPFAWYNIGASLWNNRSDSKAITSSKLRTLISPKGSEVLFGKGKRTIACARTTEGLAATAQILIDNIAAGETPDHFGEVSTDEFAQRLMIAVLFHEVGHSLGLDHNFKASLSFDGMKPAGPENPTTWSVMDYNYYQHELHLFDSIGGTSGPILEYDRQIISQIYGDGRAVASSDPTLPTCNDTEADDSGSGVDPLCQRYDSESNPIQGVRNAYSNVMSTAVGAGLEKRTLAEALSAVESVINAKFAQSGSDVSPDTLKELGAEVGGKVGKLVRYFVVSGAQSLRGNISNNDKAVRLWQSGPLKGAPGFEMNEGEFRSTFHDIAKDIVSWKGVPTVPAAKLSKLGEVVAAAVRLNPSAGSDDQSRIELAKVVQASFASAITAATDVALKDLRVTLYRNIAYQENNPFAIRYAQDGAIADFEGWSSKLLVSATLNSLQSGDSDTIEATEDERINAAKVLKTFSEVSDDVAATKNSLTELVRLGRISGNQAQVDASRRALKEFQ